MEITTNRDGSIHRVSAELAEGVAAARAKCEREIARLGGFGASVTGPAGPGGEGRVITGTLTRVCNEFFVAVSSRGSEYIANPENLATAP